MIERCCENAPLGQSVSRPEPMDLREASRWSAEELHQAADHAAYEGDYRTADALRLLEGNARGAAVMRNWMYEHLAATEDEIKGMAQHLALGWGASAHRLEAVARSVLIDAAKPDQVAT